MNKLLVICGPTATGKTSIGIKLAEKFGGEIVSADSRQVYKGMDIGTGKDIPKNSKLTTKSVEPQLKAQNYKIGYCLVDGIKIWLYDIVEPDYQFSVADYVKCANLVIKDVCQRGKLPILVGGTGLYIKTVVDGIATMGIEPDWKLRKKLSHLEIKKLRKKLKRLDPKRWEKMNESDRNNPRRLIRAIEIAIHTQKSNRPTIRGVFPHGAGRATLGGVISSGAGPEEAKEQNFCDKVLFIGLTAEYKILYERIDRRVDERVKEGIIKEIRGLLRKGYTWKNSVLGETIGYKEWREYFTRTPEHQNTRTKLKEEIIQKWKYNEHGYARRQMTWFKKDKRIFWFDISKKGWENKIMSFLEKQQSI